MLRVKNPPRKTKLLTFESWVTRCDWYQYAITRPNHLPLLLIDRSPCQDPFFDPYAPSAATRRPLISGLCRGIKGFQGGERYLCITRLDDRVALARGMGPSIGQPRYFGVAALIVTRVHASHADAASTFTPRQFVSDPPFTAYPPNLAFEDEPLAAVGWDSCIVHHQESSPDTALKWKPVTPPDSSPKLWKETYQRYLTLGRRLPCAECRCDVVDRREALALDPSTAPVFTRDDWDGRPSNTNGLLINAQYFEMLCERIASRGSPT